MRKTWRLLREKLPHIFTYGCAPHCFNLHSKDILKLAEFADTVDDLNLIVNYMNKHTQAGGLATLRKHQKACYGKLIAIQRAGKTRWTSVIACATSVTATRDALTRTVNDKDFDKRAENATRVRKLILDAGDDDSFWDRVALLIRVLEPLRVALLALQADNVTMGDVYASVSSVRATSPADLFPSRPATDT